MYQLARKQFGVVAAKPDLKPSRAGEMENTCVWLWLPLGRCSLLTRWAIIICHPGFREMCEEPVKSGWTASKILFSDHSFNHTHTHPYTRMPHQPNTHTHTHRFEPREDYFSFTVEINERVSSLNLMLTPSLLDPTLTHSHGR